MTDDDELADIIEFPRAGAPEPDRPITVRHRRGACLMYIARQPEHWSLSIKALRLELKRLESERDSLKREVTNLRAQKRRAQGGG